MNTNPRNGFPTFGAATRAQNRRSPVQSRPPADGQERSARLISRTLAAFAHREGRGVFGK